MSPRTRAFIAIIIASILWGTAGVTAKILVRDVDPFVASFYRFLIASLFILPFFIKEQRKEHHAWKNLIPLSMLGGLNVPLYFLGIKLTTANSATLIYTIAPLATAFFSSLLIKEIHSFRKILGILIGFAGALFIIVLPLIEKNHSVTGDFTGNIFVVCAMLFWTLYSIGTRHLHINNKYSPVTMTSIYFFSTTFISFFFAVIFQKQFIVPALFSPLYIGTLFYSGIFITLITYFLYQWAIKRIGVTTASLKQYIELIVGVFLNTLFLGETISRGFIIGALFVILGLTIATGSKVFFVVKQKLFKKS